MPKPSDNPKTPESLREQLERANAGKDEHEADKSAEGIDVPPPSLAEFFGNLGKLSEPEK